MLALLAKVWSAPPRQCLGFLPANAVMVAQRQRCSTSHRNLYSPEPTGCMNIQVTSPGRGGSVQTSTHRETQPVQLTDSSWSMSLTRNFRHSGVLLSSFMPVCMAYSRPGGGRQERVTPDTDAQTSPVSWACVYMIRQPEWKQPHWLTFDFIISRNVPESPNDKALHNF